MQCSHVGIDSRKSASPFDDPFSFDNRVYAVHCGQRNLFLRSAGPVDFHFVHFRCGSQTKMQTLIGSGGVTSPAEHVPALANFPRGNKRFRSNSITGALLPTDQFQRYPMVGILHYVSEKSWRRIYVVDHHVDVTIVEQIPERSPARGDYYCEAGVRGRRNFLKFRSVQIPEKQRTLRPGRSPILLVYAGIDVAIGRENIEQTVVVVVEESSSPAQKGKSDGGYSRASGNIGKIAIAVVTIQSIVVVGKIGDIEIDFSVAVVVAHGDTHGCLLAPFVIQGEPGNITNVLERAVVLVAVEVLGDGVVRNS